jgi:thymidylate synthase (FAD)
MNDASQHYDKMIAMGCPAELARSVLPNSLKTEIVITGNVRSWRNFITLRSSKAAHPQIRLIANDILRQLNEMWPELFEDVVEKCK